MTLGEWIQIAQVGLFALVPAIAWVAKRLSALHSAIAQMEKRVSVIEEHDVGDLAETIHGRVTDVATGLAELKGAVEQLNNTNGLLLRALIRDNDDR